MTGESGFCERLITCTGVESPGEGGQRSPDGRKGLGSIGVGLLGTGCRGLGARYDFRLRAR
jgi:hypothetical protein